jgi:hypothetical protein
MFDLARENKLTCSVECIDGVEGSKPKYARQNDDPSQEKDSTDANLLSGWHLELPDDGDRHEYNDDVREHVDNRGAENKSFKVDASAVRKIPVPRKAEGLALKDGGERNGNEPADNEPSHSPNGNAEAAERCKGAKEK